jgi:hypothetical protein
MYIDTGAKNVNSDFLSVSVTNRADAKSCIFISRQQTKKKLFYNVNSTANNARTTNIDKEKERETTYHNKTSEKMRKNISFPREN